jgi:hypothetical protein
MTEEEQLHAVDVITRVRERLEAQGADAELFRLRRFSSDELQILVRLELGLEGEVAAPKPARRLWVVKAA